MLALPTFHLHHIHRDLFLPHPENFKVCDNALLREKTGVMLQKLVEDRM